MRSATARRHRATAHTASKVTTTTMANFQLSPSYQNTLDPRTFSTAIGPNVHESCGGGNALRTIAMYASRTIARSGTLRTTSTNAFAALRRMKFWDRRATPTSVPRTVARMIPVIDSRNVL